MISAEDFRDVLIEISHIDADVMMRAGICQDTAKRMLADPIFAFRTMTRADRALLWPLVTESLALTRGHRERADLSGESSRHIDSTQGAQS